MATRCWRPTTRGWSRLPGRWPRATGASRAVTSIRCSMACAPRSSGGWSARGRPSGATFRADTLALVVKPQDMGAMVAEIAAHVRPGQLVVSLAAGITTRFIESRLADGVAVVRVMPNTPALVDEGMAAISPGSHCDDVQLHEAEQLLLATGRVVRVPEKQQDAVTAISGTGPAYVFYVVEAMIEAGVHLGLPRATATELVVQTVVGSAKLLRETGEHPTVLREQVTSPAGTTAAAVRILEEGRVRADFLAAIEAARDRSRALAAVDD